MRGWIAASFIGAALCGGSAMADEIKVFSAGAVEPGGLRAATDFKRASGHDVRVEFNTAPQLAQRLAAGDVADLLIAPPAALDEQTKNGKLNPEGRIVLGRVGAGIVVRASAPNLDVATTDALKRTLLGADRIVYNTASTGIYLEKLFEKMGIGDALKAKTTRYPNGERVMEHIIKGSGNEVGFGAITEIKLFEPKGVKLAGPLPADVQNYTTYGAALMSQATSPGAAKAFLKYLASPEAKQAFAAVGIE